MDAHQQLAAVHQQVRRILAQIQMQVQPTAKVQAPARVLLPATATLAKPTHRQTAPAKIARVQNTCVHKVNLPIADHRQRRIQTKVQAIHAQVNQVLTQAIIEAVQVQATIEAARRHRHRQAAVQAVVTQAGAVVQVAEAAIQVAEVTLVAAVVAQAAAEGDNFQTKHI